MGGLSSTLPAATVQGGSEPRVLQTQALQTHDCAAQPASCAVTVSQAAPPIDTPAAIISDHIRRQGYTCEEPRAAERDQPASRPNETVWILRCGNATYRVTLVPDMAARVERLP
jgi:hypothetical protein